MALIARSVAADDDGQPKLSCAPAEKIAAWLAVLRGGAVEGMVELRAIDVTRAGSSATHVESTLYCPDAQGLLRMARDARAISPRASGVYWTLNPVMTTAAGAAKDSDIARRIWLPVDIDPVRPADVSATDAEKRHAVEAAVRAVRWLTKYGFPEPLQGDSGNGWHLLYRVDLPNDDATTDLIKKWMAALAHQVDSATARVDTAVYNASRIFKLYGTLARKGESTEERPHRVTSLASIPDPIGVATREQLEAVVAMAEGFANVRVCTRGGKSPAVHRADDAVKLRIVRPRRGIIARDLGDDPKTAFVSKAVAEEIATLEATAPGGRNHELFRVACKLFELVKAGELDQGDTERDLRQAAERIGLKGQEVDKTIKSAWKKVGPRDLSHVGKKAPAPVVVDPITGLKEHADDPHRLAREFIKARYHHEHRPTIVAWNEEWHVWRGGRWVVASDREVNADLARFAKEEFDRQALASGKKAQAVGTRLVGNIALALRSIVILPVYRLPEQPAWLDVDGPPPRECIATQSGILHLPRLELEPLTPRFFSPNILSYAYDENAAEPTTWLDFLASVWPKDPASIECLQEWFGYLLTTDTRQQKILMLVGPKRSGKGTIANTIKALIGEDNVTAPTLSSLGTRFGSQPLINKTAAICTESRMTGRSDSQAIVERLLSISGEDPQSIERKTVGNWNGTLRTRFILQGNELPRLGDYSSALPSRLILLKMDRSFLGKEDRGLGARIRAEMPGILWWAIQGWERLQARGHFLQPESGNELLKEFEDLNNPVGAFVAEQCETGPHFEVPVKKLYEAWKNWCEKNGKDHPGDLQGFGRNLKACLVGIKTGDRREDGRRFRAFVGLRLLREDEAAF